MVPPFYFKCVSDEGLFAYYAEVIERVASDALRVYLSHNLHSTQVPVTLNLIEMLRKRYPNTIAGAKDSSGIWSNTQAKVDTIRQIFQAMPMIPAMKRAVAEYSGDAAWKTVRPPLCDLDDIGTHSLMAQLRAAEFALPGYPGVLSPA